MAPPPIPTHSPDDVRRAVDDVLARPEFGDADRSFVERALDWILRRLERLFGGDGDPGDLTSAGGSGGSTLFTVLVAIAAAVCVYFAVRALRGSWRRRSAPAGDDLTVDVEAVRGAAAWDDLARRLEAEGRWKEAMRARFGSLVTRLADRGAVPATPGRTTGELRTDVRSSLPDAAEAFGDAADLFDRAWYGGQPTGPDEAARFARNAELVLAAEERR